MAEMVREAERIIDGQLKAIEELDDKAETVIRLAVLGVILGLAMGSLVATGLAESPDPGRIWTLSVIGGGLLSNLIALYMVFHSYSSMAGAGRMAQSSPDIPDLVERAKPERLADIEYHQQAYLMGLAPNQIANTALMLDMVRWRRRGVRLMAAATLPLYVASLVLIAVLSFL